MIDQEARHNGTRSATPDRGGQTAARSEPNDGDCGAVGHGFVLPREAIRLRLRPRDDYANRIDERTTVG